MKASKYVPATKSNELVFLDILTIKKSKNGRKATLVKKNWITTVEKLIRMKL